jgi:SOS-response transcriptional repressor LexA
MPLTKIGKMLNERHYTTNALAEEMGVTRYLVTTLCSQEPQTPAQRRLARKIVDFFEAEPEGASRTAGPRGIPLVGEIPAGPLTPFEGRADPIDYVSLDSFDRASHFALRVHGNSMSPLYQDRDIVICRVVEGAVLPLREEGPTPVTKLTRFEGRVVCALVDGTETTLKRLEITRTGRGEDSYVVNLRPLNDQHPTIVIGPNNTLAIQGEVVRIIRDV